MAVEVGVAAFVCCLDLFNLSSLFYSNHLSALREELCILFKCMFVLAEG